MYKQCIIGSEREGKRLFEMPQNCRVNTGKSEELRRLEYGWK